MFIENVINTPVPDESEFIIKQAILVIGNTLYDFSVRKKKKSVYIENIPMFMPIEKPDSNLSFIFNQFKIILKQKKESHNIAIIKDKREYILSFSIIKRLVNDNIFFFDDKKYLNRTKENVFIDRTIEFIEKNPEGRTKSEISQLNKNLKPEMRKKILEELENNPNIEILQILRNGSRKSLNLYMYKKINDEEE